LAAAGSPLRLRVRTKIQQFTTLPDDVKGWGY
jgi:hypothetical protein